MCAYTQRARAGGGGFFDDLRALGCTLNTWLPTASLSIPFYLTSPPLFLFLFLLSLVYTRTQSVLMENPRTPASFLQDSFAEQNAYVTTDAIPWLVALYVNTL